ncbi:MAG: hypothetical protein AB7U38_04940 [Hyphomicrobiales bacterium]
MSHSRRNILAGLLALPLLAWLPPLLARSGLKLRGGWVLRDGD